MTVTESACPTHGLEGAHRADPSLGPGGNTGFGGRGQPMESRFLTLCLDRDLGAGQKAVS